MTSLPSARIAAPRPPEPSPPFRLPVLATVAPMLAAVVLWLVTGSPFALMFAALGPVTALASVADSRIGSRRNRRRELRRFEGEAVTARSRIEEAHSAERLAAMEATPFARAIIGRPGADPWRWKSTGSSPVLVSLGAGAVRSAVEIEHGAAPAGTPAEVTAALDELAVAAATLDSAPVPVDARLGIGIYGPQPLATAVARAVALQLAWTLSPDRHWVSGVEEWMPLLPHPAGDPVRRGRYAEFGETGQQGPLVSVAVAASGADLPGACGVVLRVGGEGAAIEQHPDRAERRPLRAEAISLDEAIGWARLATLEAERAGMVPVQSRLPAVAALAPLLGAQGEPLSCIVAVDADGPVEVDLVRDGPHAVIGGTTGSGKSELLVSWVVAMAAAHGPEAVNFLLVDFKGGSAFAPLAALPHTAGIITDLDEQQAARALASLRAELRHRERFLADAAARSIDEVPGLPRLVIVVDEFAAMLVDHPDLHALFADIAARGRSLGVHLVLCTQRPAGAVRDAVLANADLRVSLRVNNRADSTAVVGMDAAAGIHASARGRGILSLAGGPARLVQFAIAGQGDVESAASRWPGSRPIRRPWQEPLPPLVPLTGLAPLAGLAPAERGISFGLLDLPEEQRVGRAVWSPAQDGNLLVLGAPRSGKSTVLETLSGAPGAPRAVWLPRSPDAAWDLVHDAPAEGLLLVDDLDSLLSQFPADHRAAFVERLTALLRDGQGRGLCVALAAQRLTPEAHGLAALAPARLMLAHASRQDLVMAGGDGAQHVDGLPPGGGSWQGRRVQVATGAAPRPADAAVRIAPPSGRPVAIVSTRAQALAARLGTVVELSVATSGTAAVDGIALGGGTVLGDVDEWQSRWGSIAALRPVADILFDRCSVADFRALTRSRDLPPPILTPDTAWRLEPDGSATRVLLPLAAAGD
ncbi:hypothetical protein BH11ACT4_BH11ACT4_25890 [soil metagenome]